MDLLDLIRTQIGALPAGAHIVGLRSVLRHIETAYKHFARGQAESDESAFTDAIYRTNQAFEGSVKEAYRVLADKDPSKQRPYDIEQYLVQHKVFRDRILWQFTNYRTVWRNPSTHDYNLDFDEAEAFLAIVSVSAFTKLLVDEIAERLNFITVQRDVATQRTLPIEQQDASQSLLHRTTSALIEFPKYYKERHSAVPIESEAQLMGALAGFLSSVLANAHTSTGRLLQSSKTHYVDIMISEKEELVLIELKRGDAPSLREKGIDQLWDYLSISNSRQGVLFLYSDKSTDYDFQTLLEDSTGNQIYVVGPRPPSPNAHDSARSSTT
jgi:hypothetical protein